MESSKISSHVNSDKTEYIRLNHNRSIETISGTTLSCVQEFTDRQRKIFSNEGDVNKSTGKIWFTDDKLCLLRRKWSLFHATVTSILSYGCSVSPFLRNGKNIVWSYTYIQKFALNVS